MRNYLRTLNNYAMLPFFNESKYPCHLDQETYERNYGSITDIKMSLKALEKNIVE